MRAVRYVCMVGIMLSPAGYSHFASASEISIGMTPIAFRTHARLFGLSAKTPTYIYRDRCPEIGSQLLNGSGRVAVEIAIVCNAIFAAELSKNIRVVHKFPHRRRLNEIAEGRIDVSATSIFPEAIAKLPGGKHPLLSNDVIRVGEFEKAIITLPDRRDVISVQDIDDLRPFKAVMNKFWVVDMKTARSLGVKEVVEITNVGLFRKFLEVGRADFTIAEPSVISSMGWAKGLVMVPGIKVVLVSPRQIPISPSRDDIQQAINRYLLAARSGEKDRVVEAYRRAGFIRADLQNWKTLNP